jgi:hypothetical protein
MHIIWETEFERLVCTSAGPPYELEIQIKEIRNGQFHKWYSPCDNSENIDINWQNLMEDMFSTNCILSRWMTAVIEEVQKHG